MKPGYFPTTLLGKLSWVTEECAEVTQAISKTIRMGEHGGGDARQSLDFYNPDLPPEERETNRDWILRELSDLKIAIATLEKAL